MLFVVAGPIGNLKDITLRALETLKEVDLIACEDTRRTGKLLQHYKIDTPLESYHNFSEKDKLPRLLRLLKEGKNIALFSDAGTPTVSDPGFKLLRACLDENIAVSPIPGPCAAITALSVSGQPTDKFLFVGFLPKTSGKRHRLLESVKECQCSSSAVFYESPFRLLKLLEEIKQVFGESASLTVCGELTKLHERILKGSVGEVLEKLEKDKNVTKGEYTVVLDIKA